jgi:hypothetical protein
MFGVLLVFTAPASAQSEVLLDNVGVQLWPEYDKPSMLVITDFQVSAGTQLPATLSFQIPLDANLIAVAAYTTDGNLYNTPFEGPKVEGEWQIFTMTVESAAGRFEYYQPISFNGEQRLFSYLWQSQYTVKEFNIRALEPRDTTSLKAEPALDSISQENENKFYSAEPASLQSGEPFALNLEYTKTTALLITEDQGVQPIEPINGNTPGRVSLGNYMPYIIGGAGLLLIFGGMYYFWRSSGTSHKKIRRRAHGGDEADESEAYCPQCGARAKAGDRFCRTCGARIRRQEE